MKSTKWHIFFFLKKPRAASLAYLCMLLISLFADIETNPGPIDYPCGNCALKVQDTDPAIEYTVVSGSIYSVSPLDKALLMIGLTPTVHSHGSPQSVKV